MPELAQLFRQPPTSDLDFVAKCAANAEERPRLLRLLRDLSDAAPVEGLRRFHLLRTLGAVRTRSDLECSLRQSARGPEYQTESTKMLTEVFSIAPKSRDESEADAILRETAEGWSSLDVDAQEEWLTATCLERPIDIPRLPEAPSLRPHPRAPSAQQLETLISALSSKSPQGAQEAALSLLRWNARKARPALLGAYLAGRIKVPHSAHLKLAHHIDSWPTDPLEHTRAAALVRGLIHALTPRDAELYRRLIALWLQRRRDGDESVLPLLRDAHDELGPFVEAARAEGDRSLDPLLVRKAQVVREEVSDSLKDPLEGLDTAGLKALARAKDTSKGLAVRAVHALSRSDAGDVLSALEDLSKARQPGVRSAALRAFHRLADHERALAVSFEVLQMETRSDVVLALMRRLAHAHYAPALPLLVGHLSHNDSHIRQHARRAVLAWGTSAARPLRHAAKKARPDRRAALLELAAELEA